MVGTLKRDVAQTLDAVGLPQHVAHLPIQRHRFLIPRPRPRVVGTPQRDVAQARDAVGLPRHVAHLAEQRQGFLIPRPRPRVVGTIQRDVAQAPDAVALPQHGAGRARRLRRGCQATARAHSGEGDKLAPGRRRGNRVRHSAPGQRGEQHLLDVGGLRFQTRGGVRSRLSAQLVAAAGQRQVVGEARIQVGRIRREVCAGVFAHGREDAQAAGRVERQAHLAQDERRVLSGAGEEGVQVGVGDAGRQDAEEGEQPARLGRHARPVHGEGEGDVQVLQAVRASGEAEHRRAPRLPAAQEARQVRLGLGGVGEERDRQRHAVYGEEQILQVSVGGEALSRHGEEGGARVRQFQGAQGERAAPGDAEGALAAAQRGREGQAGRAGQPREEVLHRLRVRLPGRLQVVQDERGRGGGQGGEDGDIHPRRERETQRQCQRGRHVGPALGGVAADEPAAGAEAGGHALVVEGGEGQGALADARPAQEQRRVRVAGDQVGGQRFPLLVAAEAVGPAGEKGGRGSAGADRRAQGAEKRGQVGVLLAIGKGHDAPGRRVLPAQFRQVLLQAEEIVAVGRGCQHALHPLQQPTEVRVLQAGAAADEEERAGHRHGAQGGLGVLVAADLGVGADAQDGGVRPVPRAVQVEDALRLAAEHALHHRLVLPGVGGPAGGDLQEVVVVGGGEDHVQVAEGIEDGAILRLQFGDGLLQPAGVLAAVGGAQMAGDLLSGREEVVQVAGQPGLDILQPALLPGLIATERLPAVAGAVAQQAGPRRAGSVVGGADGDAAAHDGHNSPVGDGLLQVLQERAGVVHGWHPVLLGCRTG